MLERQLQVNKLILMIQNCQNILILNSDKHLSIGLNQLIQKIGIMKIYLQRNAKEKILAIMKDLRIYMIIGKIGQIIMPLGQLLMAVKKLYLQKLLVKYHFQFLFQLQVLQAKQGMLFLQS